MSPTDSQRTFIYRVGEDNTIVFVTPEWEAFARQNEASQLSSESVCGQSLFGFVAGTETRQLYEMIIHKVRRDRCTIVIPFRCDSPCARRFMELAVSPWSDGQLQFEGRIVREEPRETVALLESSAGRNEEFVVVCSWCKRVDVSGGWVEVEEAVRRLALFNAVHLPQITHGICGACAERVRCEVGEAG